MDNEEYRVIQFWNWRSNIVKFYDTPLLLKLLKNNLVTKDQNFEYADKKHTASYYYQLDKTRSIEWDSLALKLTYCHFHPDKFKKWNSLMRPKYLAEFLELYWKKLLRWIKVSTSSQI